MRVRLPNKTPSLKGNEGEPIPAHRVLNLRKKLTPRLNHYVVHRPTPRQAAFLLCPQREILFGGATRGGKSDALLMAALQYVEIPGYNALIIRKNRVALEMPEGLIPRSKEWLHGTGAKFDERLKMWTFPNPQTGTLIGGATLTFGYLEGPNDKFRYQSTAYHFIGFEELCEFGREEDYTFLFSRQSKAAEGATASIPVRMRATTNPIGPGFTWVRERFIFDHSDRERLFIKSTVKDNPHVNQADYLEQLSKLPPIMRKKLQDGDWSDMGTGELFDKERFRLVEPERVPKLDTFDVSVRMWDLASTKPNERNPDPDWTAGVLLGIRNHGTPQAEVWILDVRLLRDEPGAVQRFVKETARMDGKAVPVRIFKDPGQAGKDQVHNYRQLLAGWNFDSVPTTGNKVVRAGPFAGQVSGGRVLVKAGQTWTPAFVDQHHQFPYDAHDDIVDAASSAYSYAVKQRPRNRRLPFGPRL